MNYKVSQLTSLFSLDVQSTDLLLIIDSDSTTARSKKITVGDLVDSRVVSIGATTFIPLTQKGVPNGVATLDSSGLIPSSQLPSYVDDIVEYPTLASFPVTGESGKIYVDLSTNKTYRWTGSIYVEMAGPLALTTTGSSGAATLLSGVLNVPNYTLSGLGGVPTTRQLTINGTSYDLSQDRSWTITTPYVSKLQHQVKAGVPISKGQAVYVTSADGTNMIVGLASNASEATSSKTMGLLDATVSTNGFANVVTEGLLTGIDTTGATSEGDPVWLGTGGNLIYGLLNKPYAPAHLVFIGIVTRKNANNGEIFVKVQNGFELDELHDVDLKTNVPVNGEILGYNGTLWVNKTIAGWLGYTPANASGTTNYISKFTGTTTLGNSLIYDNGTSVGIGTTSPAGILDVNANFNFNTGVGRILHIRANSSPTVLAGFGTGINFGLKIGSGAVEDVAQIDAVNNQLFKSGELIFKVSQGSTPLEAMRINYLGGIQIGTTTNAGYKLDVAGNTRVNGGNTSADTPFIINNRFQFRGDGVLQYGNASSHGRLTWDNSGAYFSGLSGYGVGLGANGALNHLFINTSGNVGIGTTSPNQKLSVSGVIEAGTASATTGAVTLYQSYASPNYLGSMSTEWGSGSMILGYGAVGKSGASGFVSTFANFSGIRGAIKISGGIFSVFSSTTAVNTAIGSDLTMTETFKVNEAGNVGIGTTTPSYKLDVNGTTRFTGNAYVSSGELLLDNNQPFRWKDSGGTARRAMLITAANDFQFGHVDSGWGGQTYLKAGGGIAFVVNGSSGASIFAGAFQSSGNFVVDTDTLVVDATNNRVGIGIASPTDKLHIVDSTNNNIFGRITATGTNASAAWVAMNNQNDNVVYRVFGDGVSGSQMGISLVRSASLLANLGGSGKFLLGTYSATDFVLGTGNSEKARIVDSTGNILVGTTTDNGNKLQVAGTVDGQGFAVNGVPGYTGTVTIQQPLPLPAVVFTIQNGIITNVI